MPGIYDVTPTTFSRPNDRLPEDLDGQLFQKYVGEYDGSLWFINHNLKSTNLLVEFWKDSAPYAYWWDVDIVDADNIQVQWNMPVHGRAVVYSVRDFVGVSMVYEQTAPAATWVIDHNFGTRDILIDVWVDGALLVPDDAQAISLNTIELTFSTPVDGKAVLIVVDPAASPYITVEWDHIMNKPMTFPPSSVPIGVAEMAKDAQALGGKQPHYYLNTEQLGKLITPLELVDPATNRYVVPYQYLPDASKVRFRDHANTFIATEVYIDDEHSPLRMGWVASSKRVVLSTAFLVRKVQLLGSTPNPGYPKAELEASSDFLVRMKAGLGIIFNQLDLHTVEIASSIGTSRRFTRSALLVGVQWDIIDPVFATPGDCLIQLYESQFDPTLKSGLSNHIVGTPTFSDVFEASGDDVMTINGDKLEVRVDSISNHFVHHELYVNDGYADTIAPGGPAGIWGDAANGRYVIGVPSGPTYIFHAVDITLAAVTPIVGIPSAGIPGPVCLSGAYLYAIQPDATGMLELVSNAFAALPTTSWVSETVFPTVPYPPAGSGLLRIRVTATHLFILNTGFNTLSGYERATGTKIWEIWPAQVIKDFDVWPDGYLSISLAAESVLWVSNAPAITTTPPTFAPSVDKWMGASHLFGLGGMGTDGAMGIMPDSRLWRAKSSSMTPVPIYAVGEQILWLKSPHAWTVSNLWALVSNMDWASMDVSGFDDVKIAFFLGKAGSMPDTLYRWDGAAFDPFPASDFPSLGQPLSIVNTMSVQGGQELSYALYIKRGDAQWSKPSFVEQNFACQFQGAGVALVVPISGDGRPGTAQIICAPNQVSVVNTTGTPMTGLKLLASPVV